MDVLHTARMPWGENLAAQRSGGMAHKLLFEGEEGSPDNHMLVLADEKSDYYSPRHRHPWDQVRYCLTGAVPIGKGLAVEAGEAAYFPEGAPYGPQEGGPDRIELLLQFGGASGKGYIGADRLRAARAEMAAFGRFEKGVFTREDGEGRRNQDAYEAIWQHVTGAPLDYPDPAYRTPVVMRPEALPWSPDPAHPGVEKRVAGIFPHRRLAVEQWKLAPGAAFAPEAGEHLTFLYVCRGEGTIGGEGYETGTAVRLGGGESPPVSAAAETVMLAIRVGLLESAAAGRR